MKLRTLFGGLLAALGFTVVACGGGGNPNYRVPVDSPLMSFQAPEKEELLGEDVDLSQPVDEAPPEGDEGPKPAPAAKPAPAPKAPVVTPAPATKPQ